MGRCGMDTLLIFILSLGLSLLVLPSIASAIETTDIVKTRFTQLCSNGTSPHALSGEGVHRRSLRCAKDCAEDVTCRGVIVQHDEDDDHCSPLPHPQIGDTCNRAPVTTYVKERLPEACNPSSTYEPTLKSCYQVVPVTPYENMTDVRAICAELGMYYHLAAITSKTESNFIRDMLGNSAHQFVWTGGFTDTPGSSPLAGWSWHLGGSLTVTLRTAQHDGWLYWANSEPDNKTGDQKAIVLMKWTGEWNWGDLSDDPSSHGNTYMQKKFAALCELN